jgi:hypothetical protein
MSFLAPLFALGLLAVGAPILFHLIRRQPRGQVQFSSLMFLSPTPPRFTRRSRPEHWLLLLLRAGALAILALAFMRPFIRWEASPNPADSDKRRVAILIDTSASMRRGDLWKKALAQVNEVLDSCRPTDQVGIFVFDSSLRPVLSFRESAALEPGPRLELARERVEKLKPTWAGTDLGRALSEVLSAVVDVAESRQPEGRLAHRIVLVSDLQQGSRLDALSQAEWPTRVELELKTITEGGGNAGLNVLRARSESEKAEEERQLRVRIYSDSAAPKETFSVSWADARAGVEKPIETYVPPGQSRVVRIPHPPDSGRRVLLLKGDAHSFDNRFFVPERPEEEVTVLFLGADAPEDQAGLRFYLEVVLAGIPGRKVRVVGLQEETPFEEIRSLPLVVATGEIDPESRPLIQRYLREGGTVVYVVTAAEKSETLATLAEVSPWDIEEAPGGHGGTPASPSMSRSDRYALLRDIDFEHPLFKRLAGPQFSDFTKIHFWKHRRVARDRLGEARVLASFESGDPAILEKSVGKGNLVVLTSGWQPADSELARSTKFFPMMLALLERRTGQGRARAFYQVGDQVPLPTLTGVRDRVVVRKPDDTVETLPAGSKVFSGTDQPGVYTIEAFGGSRPFAVNLDPQESNTVPLAVETLEQLGCRLVGRADKEATEREKRQMRDVELESRQKAWRWLVLTAIGLLLVETCLAGWLTRPEERIQKNKD